jgi:hypothetical protein
MPKMSLSLWKRKLCSFCRKIDLSGIGVQPFDLDPPDPERRKLIDVLKKSRHCFFCRIAKDFFEEWAQKEYEGIFNLKLDDAVVNFSLRHLFSVEDDVLEDDDSLHLVRYEISFVFRPPEDELLWVGPQQVFQKCAADLMTVGQLCEKYPGLTWPLVEPYTARIRPLVVDARLIRKWKNYCEHKHDKSVCVSRGSVDALPFIRLIDVRQKCLVEKTTTDLKKENISWLALSYVWGRAKVPVLKKKALKDFLKPGYFTASSVPQTIWDAITLTHDIGEQHLWVDSVCILQDSDEDKLVFIPRMDIIYGLAVITIINASGNGAHDPIPGVRPFTRSQIQTSFELNGTRIVQCLDPSGTGVTLGYLGQYIWTTRGWTFQEGILSTRLLIFTDQQVYWECSTATWCEDSHWEVDNIPETPRVLRGAHENSPISDRWSPDIMSVDKNYRAMVNLYSQRELTNGEDGLNAFTGICKAIERAAGLKFIWGMPVKYLGACLTWPCQYQGMQRRAEKSLTAVGNNSFEIEFPSWSWVGWQGEVYYNDSLFGYIDCLDAGLLFHVISPGGKIEALPRTTVFREYETFPYEIIPKTPSQLWQEDKTDVDASVIPEHFFSNNIAPGLLLFYTSCAELEIDFNGKENENFNKNLPLLKHGEISITPVWFQRPDFAELKINRSCFIVLGRDTREAIRKENRICVLTVIEDDIGAFQRIGMLHLSEDDWNCVVERAWRLVILR